LIPQARTFARQTNHTAEVDVFLLELALRARDPGLQSVIRKYYPKASDEDWEKVFDDCHSAAEKAIAECRRPILDLLPETPLEPANVSATMRRAVPRTGRNDPCHCGSGKKYKNCCYDKDRERLQHFDYCPTAFR